MPLERLVSAGVVLFLHATAKPQHEVQRALLLDVVVAERPPVLQLLAGEDEALLVGRDALLVLDLWEGDGGVNEGGLSRPGCTIPSA